MPDRKGLPSVDHERSRNKFFVINVEKGYPPPLIVGSYSPKKGKNMLLLATAHEDPGIHPEAHKKEKSIVIDFHNDVG